MDNIISAAKTDVFRLRVNPEIRKELEAVYAKNGLTLTDAVNVFFQQSLNAGGFPFQVTENNAELVKAKAMTRLMKELKKGCLLYTSLCLYNNKCCFTRENAGA